MKTSLSLGRFFGIKVYIHWSFIMFLIWIAFSNYKVGWVNIIWTLVFILSVFTCITLHEFGHALMAKRFGVVTRDVTLYPIGGVASLEKIPEKPSQELAVALAGPAVNIVIALLLLPFIEEINIIKNLSDTKEISQYNIIQALFSVNVMLPLFNMIPAFPMDGGRALRAILSMKLNRPLATRIAATLGQAFAVLMVIGGFNGNPFLVLIGAFVFLSAESEAQYVKQQALMKGLKVGDAMMRQYPRLRYDETIENAIETLLDSPYKRFLIMDSDKVVGLLTDQNIIKGISEKSEKTLIGDLMHTKMTFLNPDMLLEESLSLLQNGAGFLPVQKDGILIGVLDMENIVDLLLIRQMRDKKQANKGSFLINEMSNRARIGEESAYQ